MCVKVKSEDRKDLLIIKIEYFLKKLAQKAILFFFLSYFKV